MSSESETEFELLESLPALYLCEIAAILTQGVSSQRMVARVTYAAVWHAGASIATWNWSAPVEPVEAAETADTRRAIANFALISIGGKPSFRSFVMCFCLFAAGNAKLWRFATSGAPVSTLGSFVICSVRPGTGGPVGGVEAGEAEGADVVPSKSACPAGEACSFKPSTFPPPFLIICACDRSTRVVELAKSEVKDSCFINEHRLTLRLPTRQLTPPHQRTARLGEQQNDSVRCRVGELQSGKARAKAQNSGGKLTSFQEGDFLLHLTKYGFKYCAPPTAVLSFLTFLTVFEHFCNMQHSAFCLLLNPSQSMSQVDVDSR